VRRIDNLLQKSKSQAEVAQQRCERFGDRKGPKKFETRSRVRMNGGPGPGDATASNRGAPLRRQRRSGADEGGQAFGSSRAPRRGNSLRGGIGLTSGVAGRSSLRWKALWAGKAAEPSRVPSWKRSWRRPGNGSPRQESQRFGRSPLERGQCSRGFRCSDPPQRDRWREPPVSLVGSSRATSAIRRLRDRMLPGREASLHRERTRRGCT